MKKHIILPFLVAMFACTATVKANPGFISAEPDSEKAAALAEQASWTILLNFFNTDSLNYAVTLCNKAIDLSPGCAEAYSSRGFARYFMNDYQTAEKDFDVAVQKRGSAQDFEDRGECKFHLSDNDGALADYQSAAAKGQSLTASGADLLMADANDLGIAFYNAGQYTKAVQAFTISINSEITGTNLFNRANAEYMNGDSASACTDWHTSWKMGSKQGKKAYKKMCR